MLSGRIVNSEISKGSFMVGARTRYTLRCHNIIINYYVPGYNCIYIYIYIYIGFWYQFHSCVRVHTMLTVVMPMNYELTVGTHTIASISGMIE